MNALLKNESGMSSHYWMMWIAPSPEEKRQIKTLPPEQKQRVLMLHPKNASQIVNALQTAITSGLYHSITLDKALIPNHQHQFIEMMAMKYCTHINWLKKAPVMNSACQMSLI